MQMHLAPTLNSASFSISERDRRQKQGHSCRYRALGPGNVDSTRPSKKQRPAASWLRAFARGRATAKSESSGHRKCPYAKAFYVNATLGPRTAPLGSQELRGTATEWQPAPGDPLTNSSFPCRAGMPIPSKLPPRASHCFRHFSPIGWTMAGKAHKRNFGSPRKARPSLLVGSQRKETILNPQLSADRLPIGRWNPDLLEVLQCQQLKDHSRKRLFFYVIR